jgi:hypothetical protein
MKRTIKHPKIDPRKDPELRKLANLVGEFIEYWGFKAVQGRMWCYIYLSKDPLSSIQLSKLLEISPALVTQSVQVLLKYHVILEAEKGPNGVLRFEANPNASEAVAAVLSSRESILLDRIWLAHKGFVRAGAKSQEAEVVLLDEERVIQFGEWVELARFFLKMGVRSLMGPDNAFENPVAFRSAVAQVAGVRKAD